MAAKSKVSTKVRCAMTDEQYHSVYQELSKGLAMVNLVSQVLEEDADWEVIVALDEARDAVKRSQDMMERFYEETRNRRQEAARHGG